MPYIQHFISAPYLHIVGRAKGGVARVTPMQGVQAGIDWYTWGKWFVPSILGWMIRYGRDATEGQEGGASRGDHLTDVRMETPPSAEACW